MEFLLPALNLATEVFKLINTEASRKYLDQSVRLQLDLQSEVAKPYDQQDDARIVELKKQVFVIVKAAQTEAEAHQAVTK